jgi:hypothetical protein
VSWRLSSGSPEDFVMGGLLQVREDLLESASFRFVMIGMIDATGGGIRSTGRDKSPEDMWEG